MAFQLEFGYALIVLGVGQMLPRYQGGYMYPMLSFCPLLVLIFFSSSCFKRRSRENWHFRFCEQIPYLFGASGLILRTLLWSLETATLEHQQEGQTSLVCI